MKKQFICNYCHTPFFTKGFEIVHTGNVWFKKDISGMIVDLVHCPECTSCHTCEESYL